MVTLTIMSCVAPSDVVALLTVTLRPPGGWAWTWTEEADKASSAEVISQGERFFISIALRVSSELAALGSHARIACCSRTVRAARLGSGRDRVNAFECGFRT